MNTKTISGVMLTLLLTSMLMLAISSQSVKAILPYECDENIAKFLPTKEDRSEENSQSLAPMEIEDEGRECRRSWVPFEGSRWPGSPQVEVLRSDEQACVLTITIHGMYKERIKAEGKEFEKLRIPEYGFTSDFGRPQLPVIRGLIEIPSGKNVSLTVIVLHSLGLFNYTVYPAQEPTPESKDVWKENALQYDQAFYSIDAYYPNSLVSISPPAQLRDHTVVQLSVYPIRFNPVINRLNISIDIKIGLEYYDVGEPPITRFNKLYSPVFDESCMTTIWNYNFSKSEAVQSGSAGYLIISNDTFYSSMNSFVNWKTANGLEVTSVKLSDIGVNDTDIYNYIYNAFHTWTTPPTYVLLVGDVECVPTHYGLDHPYEGRKTATDHYYACVSGSDYLPDLFVGRLSVKSVSELNNALDKIIGYNGFFNKRVTLVSDTEHFEETSDWIYSLLCAKGYAVDKFYDSLGTATASNIGDALDDGRVIINYRGHGSPTGWGTGSFYNSHVLSLNNGGKYPIVVSCTCSSGEYDYVVDCFGETWMKAEGKGAVAFFGSSRVSYSGYNDELSKGVYKAIFNDGLDEFGPITVKAKLYMYNYYGDGFYTQLEYELYNTFTDPQLYTSFPEHELTVNLDSPTYVAPSDSKLLNATVSNIGLQDEVDVELFLMIDGNVVSSTVISELFTNHSYTISYLWAPTTEDNYNVTAYVPPLSGESYTWNNVQSTNVLVQLLPDILVVNDDDGAYSVSGTSLWEFESVLSTVGYDYIVWNESSKGNPSLDFLTRFKLVIWTCGDHWSDAVDASDAATLEEYLAQGGNILLEGEDIGYDHYADSFMINVAHATYQVDNTGAPGLTVTDSTHPVTQGLPTNFTWLTDPPYDDGVTTTNGGSEVIRYTSTSWTAATVFNGTGTSSGSVVYYTFPIYCLAQPERETLVNNSVNWLLVEALEQNYYLLTPPYHKADHVGETFQISVSVIVPGHDGHGMYGYTFKLYWNRTLINATDVTVTRPSVWDTNWVDVGAGLDWDYNATYGRYETATTALHPAGETTGNFTLVTIDFEVIHQPIYPEPDGYCLLNLTDVQLSGISGYKIPISVYHSEYEIESVVGVHDVAVTDIQTVCYNDHSVQIDKTIVCKNYTTCINVTMANEGNFAETTDVALWVQSSSTYQVGATLPVTLAPGASKEITFIFNSTVLPLGNYTLFANATIVSGETNVTDNNLTDGWVIITISGDIDGDGHVFLYDLTLLGAALNSSPGDSSWYANADIDGDCYISIYDLSILGTHWGE